MEDAKLDHLLVGIGTSVAFLISAGNWLGSKAANKEARTPLG